MCPLLATPGAEDLATEPMSAEPTTPDAGAETPPAKRDEKVERDEFGRPMTTTANSKGKWYTPKNVRGGDRRTGKRQSFNASGGNQNTGKNKRSFLPGMSDLYKFSENQNSNYYDEQEKEIFQENIEVKNLIETLNQLEKPSDETET